MLRRPGARRPRLIAKICLICIILSCIFIFASCVNSTTKTHACTFGGTQITSSSLTEFKNTVQNRNITGTYTYYLGEKITLDASLQIPEGTFVGICVDEFSITVKNNAALFTIVDTDGDPSNNKGGVYLFDCEPHAIHSKVTYQYVDQTAFNFFGDSGASMYNAMGAGKNSYAISLKTDINIPSSYESLVIPAGKTLYVCTNGYSFNSSVNLERNGGRLAFLNCKDPGFHECLYLDDGAVGITQDTLSNFSTALADTINGEEIHVYLNGDIAWTGELEIPTGVTVRICLNGYSVEGAVKKGTYTVTETDENGATVTLEKPYGELVVFDCSHHLCSGVCMTGEMLSLNKNSIAWTEDLLRNYFADPENPETVYCVLEDDVDVPLIEGVYLLVCVNGFPNRENQWLTKTVDGTEVTVGGITYYNCASSHLCEIASMVGLENKSILHNTADGVNMFLEQLSDLSLNAACFSLTADLIGTGEIAAPEGTYAILCLNGYSMGDVTVAEGGNVFVYECNHEYCSEMKSDVISLDQGIIDLLAVFAQTSGKPYPFNANYIFALTEDVTVPANTFEIADGFHVNFCLRGHTITGVDNVSGVLTHKGCTHRTSPHICDVANMIGQTSTPLKVKSAGAVTSALSGLGEGTHFFHLTDNLTGSGEITAPAGAVVGICLDGYSKGDVKVAEGSQVYFYECGKHYCTAEKENVPVFDQGAFDFFIVLLKGNQFTIAESTVIALSEDVHINATIAVLDDELLNFCTCGHSVSAPNVIGDVLVHDDADNGSYNHFCAVPYIIDHSFRSDPLYATSAAMINVILAEDADKQFGFYHLTHDIVGGALEIPENMVVMICLNGFELKDVVVPENAYVFFYECGTQYCHEIEQTIPALSQSVFDFFEFVVSQGIFPEIPSGGEEPYRGIYLAEDTMFALMGDCNIPFDVIVAENYALGICTCGYKLTTSDGVTLQNVYPHTGCTPEASHERADYGNTSVPGSCSICSGTGARPLNPTTLREMIGKDGVVSLPKGSYYFYLENDFQLTRMLVIPEGVDIHICLHGYTLYSAYLWSDITTYGAGYPEAQCSAVAVLYGGASLNIYDCSEKMTGTIALKQFRLRDSTGKMQLAFDVIASDESQDVNSIQSLAISLGTSMINYGTINIYGGNIYSITGIVNGSGGVLNFYNGNLGAMFAAVINMDVATGAEAYGSSVYIGEGATVSSIYMGIISAGGEVTLDGGTVNAGLLGIMAMSETGADPVVTINGGEINVGSSDRLMMAAMNSWASIGGEVMDFQGMSLDLGADEYCGVSTTGTLILNGDVDVVMGEMTVTKDEDKPITATDFYLAGGNAVIVSNNVKGKYTLKLDGAIDVNNKDTFIPLDSSYASSNSGGTTITPVDPDFKEYASVVGMSVVDEGAIKVNIYTEIDPAVIASGRVRFYAEYANGVQVYTLDDAKCVISEYGTTQYVFSIYTAAKDYSESIYCYFTLAEDPTLGEEDPLKQYVDLYMGAQSISIKDYLDRVINARAYSDSVVNLAKAMKNYCASAAYHFEVAENYTVVDGVAPYLDQVEYEILNDFKATQGEAYADAPVTFKTATLILESETSIRLYIQLDEGYEIETDADGNFWLVTTVDGQKVKTLITVTVQGMNDTVPFTIIETGIEARPYCIEISDIYAKDYFTMYSVKLDGKVYMNYSVASWCRTIIKNESKYTEDVVDMAKSLVVYGYSAVARINSLNPTPAPDEGGAE